MPTAIVPQVDLESILKARAKQRANDDAATLKAAKERVSDVVPQAHLALHDLLQHFADQHPDEELPGLNAIGDGAEAFVENIKLGLEELASRTASASAGTEPDNGELEQSRNQVKALEAKATEAATEVGRLEVQAQRALDLKIDLKKSQGRVEALTDQNTELQRELETVQKETRTLREQLTTATTGSADQALTKRVAELDEAAKSHKDALQAKDEEIGRLNTSNTALIDENTALKNAGVTVDPNPALQDEVNRWRTWVPHFLYLEEQHLPAQDREFTISYNRENDAVDPNPASDPQQDPSGSSPQPDPQTDTQSASTTTADPGTPQGVPNPPPAGPAPKQKLRMRIGNALTGKTSTS